MSDIVARLKTTRVIGFTGGGSLSSDGYGETYVKQVKQLVNPDGPEAADHIAALEARNARLEEILATIRDYQAGGHESYYEAYEHMKQVARQALTTEQTNG